VGLGVFKKHVIAAVAAANLAAMISVLGTDVVPGL
jgi:hypothetical protein